ncbi:phage tail sheath family protein, partial [Ruminococcus sp.]|uniref:phage tail sheath family protein n=1 Tax=Ruminococcus sp. TaxID=41978 RepID=UPI00386F3796
WGVLGTVQAITAGEDLTPYIGCDITGADALFIREMLKGSDSTSAPTKILLYRLGTGGTQASATIGALTVTALYAGTRGNDISVAVSADPDNEGSYDVTTIVDGASVDVQTITELDALVANAWVTFSGTGSEITTTTGTALTSGANPTLTNSDYASFLTAIEPFRFDILALDSTDATITNAYISFITRMNEAVGRKCQLVCSGDATTANTKYVIVVGNGVKLNDGTALTASQAVYWVAGVEAGANYNQSLTYAQYIGAVEANPKLTDTQLETAVKNGLLVFADDFDVVKICTDVNSKKTVTPTEGAEFKKNRIMRVIMQFCNDTYEYFSKYFIGKVDNNDQGRALLRKWIIGYINEMQANNGVQNFTAEDVTVTQGNAVDAVLVNVAIQPVDSVEKIYVVVTVTPNTVTVEAA